MNKNNDSIVIMKSVLTIALRLISWIMTSVALVTTLMTFLSTFRIYVTTIFGSAKLLIYVLMVTFFLWALRCLIDSKYYPVYRIYSAVFFLLFLVCVYLMGTPVF